MDDCSACVLAERKDSLYGRLGIAKELQRDVFVVLAGLGIL